MERRENGGVVEAKTARENKLGVNGGGYSGLFEGVVFGHVDGHFELGQNVFGHQKRLAEDLIEHGDGDVPVAEDRRLGKLKFRREDAAGRQRSAPVFHAVAFPVLRTRTRRITRRTFCVYVFTSKKKKKKNISANFTRRRLTVMKTSRAPVTVGFKCEFNTIALNCTL